MAMSTSELWSELDSHVSTWATLLPKLVLDPLTGEYNDPDFDVHYFHSITRDKVIFALVTCASIFFNGLVLAYMWYHRSYLPFKAKQLDMVTWMLVDDGLLRIGVH
ncbi:hypothetical protein H696_01617 [Fonticula alba]|uniref:Uncharacterized protein n=1 Tax=Fonticula alba TaxID=691883 RepID=A0A058ZFG3_FONAL|nr:hypothetical protein H696_01617 [Fonticula alba]KCV72217.1 hypothetical protein H696_01617 [Fonticula alba]|eukprot:XP_009493795.1 hypothetical protein H696_01617 [Fonticula alba]